MDATLKRNGRETHERQLVAGREQRAADVALVLAQRLEACERSSARVGELETKVVEMTVLVMDVMTKMRGELAAMREENAAARKEAAEFQKVLEGCVSAGMEFKALEGKIREMKAEGTIGAESVIRGYQLAGGAGEMLEKIMEMFRVVAEMSDTVNKQNAEVAEKARLDKWLGRGKD